MEWNEAYIRLRERILQWKERGRESGPGADVPDEPLPAYAGPSAPPLVPENQQAATGTEETPLQSAEAQQRPDSPPDRRAPDEPPPNYEEAQAQQISIRLEDHIREEADRRDSQN